MKPLFVNMRKEECLDCGKLQKSIERLERQLIHGIGGKLIHRVIGPSNTLFV